MQGQLRQQEKQNKTAALNLIYCLLIYPESNGLCVRRYSNTLRDSVYSDLKWALSRRETLKIRTRQSLEILFAGYGLGKGWQQH